MDTEFYEKRQRIKSGFFRWVLAVSAAVIFFGGCAARESAYTPPVDLLSLTGATLYRYGASVPQEKLEIEADDLSAVTDAFFSTVSLGEYIDIPAGGVGYVLVCTTEDGGQWVCNYLETEKNYGFFSDGTSRIRVRNCGLSRLWEDSPGVITEGSAHEEVSDIPTL